VNNYRQGHTCYAVRTDAEKRTVMIREGATVSIHDKREGALDAPQRGA
jgi:hypothetical protein